MRWEARDRERAQGDVARDQEGFRVSTCLDRLRAADRPLAGGQQRLLPALSRSPRTSTQSSEAPLSNLISLQPTRLDSPKARAEAVKAARCCSRPAWTAGRAAAEAREARRAGRRKEDMTNCGGCRRSWRARDLDWRCTTKLARAEPSVWNERKRCELFSSVAVIDAPFSRGRLTHSVS